jgi:crossover junction endodeoxyribonuclease RusA
MTSLTLTLPWPSADLSPNARVHHFARHRAAKSAKNYAFNLAFSLMVPLNIRKGTWRGPVGVQYTFHPQIDRGRDDDNFIARMKAYRDGVALALGMDDVSFRTEPVIWGEQRKPACVVMTLTPDAVAIPLRGRLE